jgi:hypothetical protein
MKQRIEDKQEEGQITRLRLEGDEQIHNLWSTPIMMARPFDNAFLEKLREDIKYLLKDENSPGRLNQTDLWTLPDLPETMLTLKAKFFELAEKTFRPTVEMPLPPFRPGKAYFRETFPHAPYRIMPHRHANCYGVGIFYITVDQRNPGNLMFLDPRGGINWTNQFTAYKKVQAEEGLMLVHPGYLIHFVEPSNPQMGMYYGYRLALISNIHRTGPEWKEVLRERDEQLLRMGGTDI